MRIEFKNLPISQEGEERRRFLFAACNYGQGNLIRAIKIAYERNGRVEVKWSDLVRPPEDGTIRNTPLYELIKQTIGYRLQTSINNYEKIIGNIENSIKNIKSPDLQRQLLKIKETLRWKVEELYIKLDGEYYRRLNLCVPLRSARPLR
jgi:hypothetical protein